MPTPARRNVTYLILSTLLVLLLFPGKTPQARAGLPLSKVSTYLWSAIEKVGTADVLIVMAEQADLSAAARFGEKEQKGRFVWDSLRTVANRSQRALRASLVARGIDYQSFYLVNMILVRGDRDLLLQLAARSDVARLEANPTLRTDLPRDEPLNRHLDGMEGLPWGIRRVHADDVWASGVTGEGVVVGGADTGILWSHQALKESYRGWDGQQATHDTNWHDAVDDVAVPYDDHGHGTLTLGTMVGQAEGEQIGMAPSARWIGCKNMDADGYGTPARYIECFEFFLAPYPFGGDPGSDGDPALAPDVVNNSWTCPPSEGCGPETLKSAVEALRSAGIVPVFAAGNYGSGGCGSVRYPPATHDAAFTIGAFGAGDVIASFSSRGPVVVDGSGRLKPDVAAPGVSVRSSAAGGGYGSSSGTSMAAPHIAGAVSLMLAANPQLRGQVDEIERLLVEQAEPKPAVVPCGGEPPGAVPNNTWGYGIIDALAAVQAALHWPEPMPTITPTPTITSTPSPTPLPTGTPTPTATVTPTPSPDFRERAFLPLVWWE